MNELLPAGFTLRPACREDAMAVTDLVRLADIADRGESDYSLEELITFWDREGFDLEQDAWGKAGSLLSLVSLQLRATSEKAATAAPTPGWKATGTCTRITWGRASAQRCCGAWKPAPASISLWLKPACRSACAMG